MWRRRIDDLASPRAQVAMLISFGIVVVMIWFIVFLRVSAGSAAPEAKSPFDIEAEQAQPQELKEPAAGSKASRIGGTEVFQLKDPFEPALPPAAKTSEITPEATTTTLSSSAATTTTLAGSGGGGSESEGGGGTSGGGGAETGSTTTTTVASSSTRVRLDKIEGSGDTAVATISVNGVAYQVKEGDDFAGNFRLVEIGEETVTLLKGDDRIDLSVSEEIVK